MPVLPKVIGVLTAALVVAMPAMAAARDHVQITLGAAGVIPNDQAKISVIGGDVDVTNRAVPALQLEYFFTKNVSAELFCCLTRHSATAVDTVLGTFPLARVSLFPPVVTAKYHITRFGKFQPFVGAGVNYTQFFDDTAPGNSPVTAIHFNRSWGPAVQFGADYQISKHLYVRADARRVWLDTMWILRPGPPVWGPSSTSIPGFRRWVWAYGSKGPAAGGRTAPVAHSSSSSGGIRISRFPAPFGAEM